MSESISYGDEVFKCYVFYSTLMILKLFVVAFMTGAARRKKVFDNQEDVNIFHYNKKLVKEKNLRPISDDERVNRIKRIHLNDLENIPAFILLGFFYVLSGPSSVMAFNHFRLFALSRILHTIAYRFALQPLRASCYIAGLVVCLSMAVQIFMVTCY